jgi:protein gp37
MPATESKWWGESWNPIRYLDGWMCTKISPGCLHCYAEPMNLRFGNGMEYIDGACRKENFRIDEKVLNLPFHWRKPRRVFVQSMGDLFHKDIPFEWIDRILAVAYLCQSHIWQVLTKRHERIREYFLSRYAIDDSCKVDRLPRWYQAAQNIIDESSGAQFDRLHGAAEMTDPRTPLPNFWLGLSVENEKYLYRINVLNEIQAAVKFVSFEPLLGPIWIQDYLKYLQWVICGPETGPRRRPCDPEWIENIIKQCDAAGVPPFVKAFPMPDGKISHVPAEWPEWARRREFPK